MAQLRIHIMFAQRSCSRQLGKLIACNNYRGLYYGRVLVAMVPFDVPRELYAHNIRLDKVYIIGFDSYFSRFVTVLIKACTELGCVWLLS